ncbi:MAG: FprA family A-type flavoprotein [Spirochaetales bacterium]|nr:FprA family A-type flavoprotein [Spirochaetales bacterium]
MKPILMSPGIYHLGANITNGDLFEGLWPIPNGVSLNSYLVKGEKTALIDLMRDWDDATLTLEKELKALNLDFSDIDYLVLNHMEPDHTGWMRGLLDRNPNIQMILTKKAADIAREFFGVTENLTIVKTGDTLDLGDDKVLHFVEIPNVHWPETMVTFEPVSGTLFSCDAFGSYGSLEGSVFDDQISEEKHDFFEVESLRYYANIVSSFSTFVLRAIDKLKDLEIKVIAPSHGLLWRENPKEIIERYRRYAEYAQGPAEPEITVIWGSMYGNTKEVLNSVVQGIRSEKVKVHVHQVPNEENSYILGSAWKSTGIVLGMPTYEYKMFPPMAHTLDLFNRKHVFHKKAFRFGSWGWSGGAQKECDTLTETLKWDFLDPVEWQGAASDEVKALAMERGKELAREVKSLCKG